MHVVIIASANHPLREPFAGGLESLTWRLVRGLGRRGVDGHALRRPRQR